MILYNIFERRKLRFWYNQALMRCPNSPPPRDMTLHSMRRVEGSTRNSILPASHLPSLVRRVEFRKHVCLSMHHLFNSKLLQYDVISPYKGGIYMSMNPRPRYIPRAYSGGRYGDAPFQTKDRITRGRWRLV